MSKFGITYNVNKQLDKENYMICKLIAKKDFEIYNTFRSGLKIKKGQIFKGNKVKVTDDFYVITINILSVPTTFDIDVVKQFFEIRMEMNTNETND